MLVVVLKIDGNLSRKFQFLKHLLYSFISINESSLGEIKSLRSYRLSFDVYIRGVTRLRNLRMVRMFVSEIKCQSMLQNSLAIDEMSGIFCHTALIHFHPRLG